MTHTAAFSISVPLRSVSEAETVSLCPLQQAACFLGIPLSLPKHVASTFTGYAASRALTICATTASQASSNLAILTYKTSPIAGQTTGTSGMRKKTKVLLSDPQFLPNWVQSLFNVLGGSAQLSGKSLVIGGDGRFYNKVAIQTIIRMAAANGIARVYIGRNGILTTPAVSALVPRVGAVGGVVLTASHNPAGPSGDWGIKYNTGGGAPALEQLTSKIYNETLRIDEYYLADLGMDIDLSTEGLTSFAEEKFAVEIVDSVNDYRSMLKSIFDFKAIRQLIARDDFSMVFDAMHASTGEYASVIFVDELGASVSSVINGTPSEDFGGGHPDPNLTYASKLVDMLNPEKNASAPQFGAASDGDGDRNMILGRGVFVSPGDSVAIIADYAERAIPYFSERGVCGVARSMPTSSALDRVASALSISLYETPTGWKYFTNLMDAGLINICGEESFGTSSDHIREKDGLWAVLSWLSILAYKNRDVQVGKLFTVEDILHEHWCKYGRTYNMRYDFESISLKAGDSVMEHLRSITEGQNPLPAAVAEMDEFEYTDPVDGSVTSRQGIRMRTKDDAEAVFRLSGTGSDGATVRIYFERYEPTYSPLTVKTPQDVFQSLVKIALDTARIPELTGRDVPTVIT